MGTLGKPYHRKATHAVLDTARREAREARRAARDAAYRASLGIPHGLPMPRSIGSTQHSHGFRE